MHITVAIFNSPVLGQFQCMVTYIRKFSKSTLIVDHFAIAIYKGFYSPLCDSELAKFKRETAKSDHERNNRKKLTN